MPWPVQLQRQQEGRGLQGFSMEKDRILLFIPMYNCEKQITRVLGQLNREVCSYISEVLIVNNRSTDGGMEAALEYVKNSDIDIPVRVFMNAENYGLGGSHKVAFDIAVREGFDYCIVLHGDDQGDISNILPYLKRKTYRKYDCLLGARFMKGSRLEGYSAFRTFGNVVYNILFSLGCRMAIYDLGSGLNMYSCKMLQSRFYFKYKDNLMFNYCMILGSAYLKHRIRFFPILWREDDQVSNVKMVSQALTVLSLLFSFILNPEGFVFAEHRDKQQKEYTGEFIS